MLLPVCYFALVNSISSSSTASSGSSTAISSSSTASSDSSMLFEDVILFYFEGCIYLIIKIVFLDKVLSIYSPHQRNYQEGFRF